MLLGVGEVNVLLHGHHHHSPVVLQPYSLPISRLEFVLWDLGTEIWRQSNEYPKNKIHHGRENVLRNGDTLDIGIYHY